MLVDQRVPQPHPRAEVEDVIGRDPRLRHSPRQQQLAQMPRVGAVALGTLLVAAQRRRLSRLGEMHSRPRRPQLLDQESPAGRRLGRDLQLLAGELRQKPPDAGPIGRSHPRTADLTSLKLDPLRSDLRSMLVYAHHD